MRPLIQAKSLVDQTVSALRDAIIDGELPPGRRLAQAKLAKRLGVSRQPVIQALGLLEQERFAMRRGPRGLVVAPVEREHARALFQYRMALDKLAAGAAAAHAGPDTRAQGEDLIGAGRTALAAGDSAALIDADLRFHRFIYRLSGNPIVVTSMAGQWHHMRRFLATAWRHAGPGAGTWDEHEAILGAIVDGIPEKADLLAGDHVFDASRRILRALDAAAAR